MVSGLLTPNVIPVGWVFYRFMERLRRDIFRRLLRLRTNGTRNLTP